MDKKGVNYGLLFGLGFVAMVVSSIFISLSDYAETDSARTVFNILAELPVLGLSIGLALGFWKRDASGNHRVTSFWRWMSIIAVIFCVLVMFLVVLYAN
jgi:magnesium-transporting ATPase (P-type)